MGFFGLIGGGGRARASREALRLADDLEEGDGDQAPGGGDQGIAGLVPVGVVLPADDVEEVALAEGQFGGGGGRLVVVEGLDDLEGVSRE